MGWKRISTCSANVSARRFTFAELGERSRRFANALTGIGVAPGDRVFIMLPRVWQWWEIVLGCIRARVVSMPGTTLMTPKDIQYRTGLAGGTAYVTDADGARKVDEVRPETGWDLKVANHVLETAPPSESELTAIRRFDPDGFWTRSA